MSLAAAALGIHREVPFGDETLTLRPLDFADLARLSLWVEERAHAGAFRLGDEADPKPVAAALLDNIASGVYEPGGAVFDRAVTSAAGNRKVLELMLVPPADARDKAKWRADTAWRVYEDEAAFKRVMGVVAELNSDPAAKKNRRRPSPAAPSP